MTKYYILHNIAEGSHLCVVYGHGSTDMLKAGGVICGKEEESSESWLQANLWDHYWYVIWDGCIRAGRYANTATIPFRTEPLYFASYDDAARFLALFINDAKFLGRWGPANANGYLSPDYYTILEIEKYEEA